MHRTQNTRTPPPPQALRRSRVLRKKLPHIKAYSHSAGLIIMVSDLTSNPINTIARLKICCLLHNHGMIPF